MKRAETVRAGLAAASILILATGCGREKSGAPAEAGATPESGGVAIVAETADISTPLAVIATTQLDGDLAADVLNSALLRPSWEKDHLEYFTAAESPVALARSYEYVGPDSTAIRFQMRSDAHWSDGKPITAEDIVFTFQAVADPALASPRQDHVENVDSVVAQNDSTVTFYYKRRSPLMLRDASLAPIPKHTFAGTDVKQLRNHPAVLDPANGKLPTSGPWMIGEWAKGQRVVLVPNPYFTPKPHLAQIVFRIIPEPTTRLVELRTGGVDMVKSVSSDQIPSLKAQPDLRVEREEKRAFDFVAYNPATVPAFADPDVRRALSMAIDQKRLLQGLQLEEYAVPGGGPYSPIMKVNDQSVSAPLKFDPQEARRILASKGWRDTNGDSILDKDGKPFHFTLLTNAGNQRRADATQLIQRAWRNIGVDVELRQLEFNTFIQGLFQHDYEAALSGWSSGLSPDFVTLLYAKGAPLNVTSYYDPEVDALFQKAQMQPTADAARPFWQQAAAKIVADRPYSWLYYMDVLDVLRDRLKGVKIDSYGAYQNTWEWWIPKSAQRAAAPPVAPGDSGE